MELNLMFSKSKAKPKTLEELEVEIDQEERVKNHYSLVSELRYCYKKIDVCQAKMAMLYPPEKPSLVNKQQELERQLEHCKIHYGLTSVKYQQADKELKQVKEKLRLILEKGNQSPKLRNLIDEYTVLQQIREKLEGRTNYVPPKLSSGLL